MRLLGIGVSGVRLFTGMMDLANDYSTNMYYGAIKNISIATETVYNMVIKKAATEEKKLLKEKDLSENRFTVSGDGTWARRGFTSLFGVKTTVYYGE